MPVNYLASMISYLAQIGDELSSLNDDGAPTETHNYFALIWLSPGPLCAPLPFPFIRCLYTYHGNSLPWCQTSLSRSRTVCIKLPGARSAYLFCAAGDMCPPCLCARPWSLAVKAQRCSCRAWSSKTAARKWRCAWQP